MPSLNRPPLPAGCALVRDVGLYLQSLVKHKNDPSSVAPTPPPQLGLELQIECELIAEVILTALQNASGLAASFDPLRVCAHLLPDRTNHLAPERLPEGFGRKKDDRQLTWSLYSQTRWRAGGSRRALLRHGFEGVDFGLVLSAYFDS
jgi:hypothetical protein